MRGPGEGEHERPTFVQGLEQRGRTASLILLILKTGIDEGTSFFSFFSLVASVCMLPSHPLAIQVWQICGFFLSSSRGTGWFWLFVSSCCFSVCVLLCLFGLFVPRRPFLGWFPCLFALSLTARVSLGTHSLGGGGGSSSSGGDELLRDERRNEGFRRPGSADRGVSAHRYHCTDTSASTMMPQCPQLRRSLVNDD